MCRLRGLRLSVGDVSMEFGVWGEVKGHSGRMSSKRRGGDRGVTSVPSHSEEIAWAVSQAWTHGGVVLCAWVRGTRASKEKRAIVDFILWSERGS